MSTHSAVIDAEHEIYAHTYGDEARFMEPCLTCQSAEPESDWFHISMCDVGAWLVAEWRAQTHEWMEATYAIPSAA